MEVCQIVKGQRAFRRLTDKQRNEMIKHTAMKPHIRFRKIHETVSSYIVSFDIVLLNYLLQFSTVYL